MNEFNVKVGYLWWKTVSWEVRRSVGCTRHVRNTVVSYHWLYNQKYISKINVSMVRDPNSTSSTVSKYSTVMAAASALRSPFDVTRAELGTTWDVWRRINTSLLVLIVFDSTCIICWLATSLGRHYGSIRQGLRFTLIHTYLK